MKNLNMERINLIQMAYGSHGLNFCSIDRINSTQIKILSMLSQNDLINLRRAVLNCWIPKHYKFQIETQNQVIKKIEKIILKF